MGNVIILYFIFDLILLFLRKIYNRKIKEISFFIINLIYI